jgi:hypothetical protein
MTTIARMLSGCTGNTELQCQTQCEKMCTSESYRNGRNGRFYACTSQYINKLLRQINRTINEHSHLHLYPQVPRFHWAPRDGFTVEKSSYNLTGSCPLTMHPYKDYNKEVMPSYNNCIDLPLVDTDRFPVVSEIDSCTVSGFALHYTNTAVSYHIFSLIVMVVYIHMNSPWKILSKRGRQLVARFVLNLVQPAATKPNCTGKAKITDSALIITFH